MDEAQIMQHMIQELAAEVGNKASMIANLKAIIAGLEQQIQKYQEEASAGDVELLDAPPVPNEKEK